MLFQTIHKNFKLQGLSFSKKEELILFSKSISEELTFFLEEWFNSNSYVEVFTSGSTGKPKKIKLEKEHMINSSLATADFFKLKPINTALLCLPIGYIAGKMMLVRAFSLGWEIDVIGISSNPLNETKKVYDFCAMVPLQVENSIEKLGFIKTLIVGGAPISSQLWSKLQSVKTDVFATYGMTETCTHIALKKLNNFTDANSSQFFWQAGGEKKSCYQTVSKISISKDKRGCLVINAPTISKKVIYTNDLVELHSSTQFSWLGRYDNIINSGGIKLVPEQIEKKMETLFKERFFVSGLPDDSLGTKLVLLVETSENDKTRNMLFEKIRNLKSLSKFEIPKEIFFITKFKETKNNKIDRKLTLQIIST